MKLTNFSTLLLSTTVLLTVSCGSDDEGNALQKEIKKETVVTPQLVAQNYATIVRANYAEALKDAKALQASINTFVTTPTAENFEASKQAWLQSRESYGTTEAFRFADGPIDREVNDIEGPEGLLNSWPLDENFIDYVEGSTTSGIINNVASYPTITKDILEGKNGDGGEANVSVGYHAIEFLLWGQDNTAPSEKKKGLRTFEDFVDGSMTASNQDRRRAYIVACADLLIENLEFLVDQWAVGTNYSKEFEALSDDVVLTNLIRSIAELSKSELAGERMDTALNKQDQEDEHSCFSDNTHRDILLNFEGIQNVYFGKYASIEGASISQLVANKDAIVAKQVQDAFNTAETALKAIAIPFDYAISGGPTSVEGAKVKVGVDALRILGDELVEAGKVLGLTINI